MTPNDCVGAAMQVYAELPTVFDLSSGEYARANAYMRLHARRYLNMYVVGWISAS
jgi:hypothetical protein